MRHPALLRIPRGLGLSHRFEVIELDLATDWSSDRTRTDWAREGLPGGSRAIVAPAGAAIPARAERC